MSNGHGTKVRKRNGSVEPLNLEKIHKVTAEACDGLGSAVSASQVEMNSGIQFYDGISTEEIQEILVRSASDLISLEAPNYQFVAARLAPVWTQEAGVWCWVGHRSSTCPRTRCGVYFKVCIRWRYPR